MHATFGKTAAALALCALLAGCGAASAVGSVLETTADVVTAPVDLIVGGDDD